MPFIRAARGSVYAAIGLLAIGTTDALAGGIRPADPVATVAGIVVDSVSDVPLAGANVRLIELERRVDTHADGRFFLGSVPSGTYTLIVLRVGYRPATRRVTVGDDDRLDLVVRLVRTPIELPGIVVTGTLRAQASADALQPVSVVGGQQLDRQLAGTLAETLERLPGVATTSMGPATGRPVIRGLGGDRVLLLEDGARTGDLSYSSPDHAVTSDPASAERVEVVRGPAALLYGSNALSGVVNVIREEIPTTMPDGVHGRITLQGLSVNRSGLVAAHMTAPFGPLAVRLEGIGRGAGDLRTPEGRLENTDMRTFTAGAGAGIIGDWGHLGASYRYYNSSYGIPGGFVGGHDEGVTVDMRRNTFRGEWHTTRGRGLLSDVDLSGGFTHYAHEEIEAGDILGTAFRLITVDGMALARHGPRGPAQDGGLGVRAQFSDHAFGGSLGTPDARELSLAAFFLEEFEAGRFRFQVGGRYDWTRIEPTEERGGVDIGDVRPRTFGALSGSAGTLLDLGGGLALGVNLGHAFRTPNVNDLYSRGPHLAAYRVEVGNPELKLERGLGVDAFFRAQVAGARAELGVFRNRITQFIYPRETGDTSQTGLPIAQFVGENATLTGAEGTVSWSPVRSLVVDATASWVRGTLTDTGEPLPLIPPVRGSLDVRLEQRRWFAGAGVRLAARQDRLGEFEEPTDGHAVFDAVTGYRWSWLHRLHSITLRVDNLTDATYRDHLSRLKAIMPGPSRNLILLYRADF
jgi:iron complex outermembrane receptor protein